MANPSFLAQPQVQPLRQLIEEVKNGQILVPRFQRPFVWKDEQRLALLDSINRGIPIGSLMVWRTASGELGVYDRLGPFRLPDPPSAGVRSYLLDGHQRLSTLYGALAGEGAIVDDVENDMRWPMYFDLDAEDVARAFKLRPSRRGWYAPVSWLPLSSLLDPVALFELQKLLLREGRQDLARKAERVANRFKDYPIPITSVVTDDLELVTTTFRRINSRVTAVGEAHMLNAIMWASGFDLHRALEGIVDHARALGWASLDLQTIVDVLKVSTGQAIYETRLEAVSETLRDDDQLLARLGGALSIAVGFLKKECSIHGMRSLPHEYQLVALVIAAYEVGDLDRWRATKLAQWLWRTTYSEAFSGKTSGRLRKTIDEAVALARPRSEDELTSFIEVQPLVSYRRGTVRGTAFELQLARLSPLDPSTGEPVPAGQLLAYLAERPVSPLILEEGRRSPALEGLDGPENFVLLPADRIGELRSRIDAFDPNDESLVALLESHAITPGAATAWAKGDLQAFLALRRERIIADERAFVERFGMTYVDDDA